MKAYKPIYSPLQIPSATACCLSTSSVWYTYASTLLPLSVTTCGCNGRDVNQQPRYLLPLGSQLEKDLQVVDVKANAVRPVKVSLQVASNVAYISETTGAAVYSSLSRKHKSQSCKEPACQAVAQTCSPSQRLSPSGLGTFLAHRSSEEADQCLHLEKQGDPGHSSPSLPASLPDIARRSPEGRSAYGDQQQRREVRYSDLCCKELSSPATYKEGCCNRQAVQTSLKGRQQ